MWGLPPPESLSNAKMTLPLTIKNEDKARNLSRKGNGGPNVNKHKQNYCQTNHS
jgi:hypothetical protein